MKTSNYSRYVVEVIVLSVVFLLCIGVFVFYVDPYQQYRASDHYLANQRLEIAGVAKHHDFDAFVTGSSMAMNHYPEVADSLWGWKTKNFSIMGATDDDYAVMLPYILSRGKAKNVIFGIDFFSFARRRGAVNSYLYDDNFWNDYEYLWNYTSLKNSFSFLQNRITENGLYHFSSPVGYDALKESYRKLVDGKWYDEETFDYALTKPRFDESVAKLILNSDSVLSWKIYFPPYSIGEFIVYDKMGKLDDILRLKQHIIDTLSTASNVEIYDFQCVPWITNLDQYMDLRHHSHDYNKEIFRAIHDHQYQVLDRIGHTDDIKELVKIYRDSL